MTIKYYLKSNNYFIVVDMVHGGKTYVTDKVRKFYERHQGENGQFLLVYDNLEDAKARYEIEAGSFYEDYPDGLCIERVITRFFGLWKKSENVLVVKAPRRKAS